MFCRKDHINKTWKLIQPTQLKGGGEKLTRIRSGSDMVIVFPSLFHQSGLVEGKEDI